MPESNCALVVRSGIPFHFVGLGRLKIQLNRNPVAICTLGTPMRMEYKALVIPETGLVRGTLGNANWSLTIQEGIRIYGWKQTQTKKEEKKTKNPKKPDRATDKSPNIPCWLPQPPVVLGKKSTLCCGNCFLKTPLQTS